MRRSRRETRSTNPLVSQRSAVAVSRFAELGSHWQQLDVPPTNGTYKQRIIRRRTSAEESAHRRDSIGTAQACAPGRANHLFDIQQSDQSFKEPNSQTRHTM